MKIKRSGILPETSGGVLEVLRIAFPLILAASCHAVNLFTDRVMLSQFSSTAVSASLQGGLANFTISCIFFGTIGYTGTFVAQYFGANEHERIGASVWQGIFMAAIGGAFMWSSYFWAEPMFMLFGHEQEMFEQEVIYFKILSLGAILFLLNAAFSCFWSGRGKTEMVMTVSILTTILNVPLNYIFIFGNFGSPRLGIAGAAYGTILSSFAGTLIYAFFFFCPKSSRKHFGTCRTLYDFELFKRMLRYGLPNGIQLFLDLASFNIFIILLGRYGKSIGEAASIAFGINNIAFTPILGIGQTVSILVGQAIGAKDTGHAERSVRSARNVTYIYMGMMIILFTVFSDFLLAPFVRTGDAGQLEALKYAKIMLAFVAAYLVFDGTVIIYSSAIRGAGDTKYSMWLGILMAWFAFAIPCLTMNILGFSAWALWICCDLYITALGLLFYIRYKGGKWKKMRVIES